MKTVLRLQREIDAVRNGKNQGGREGVIAAALASREEPAIQKIAELLTPFNAKEIEMVFEWAKAALAGGAGTGTNQDFVAYTTLNCGISIDRIVDLLRENRKYDEATLRRMETAMRGGSTKFNEFMREKAGHLNGSEKPQKRDRGRHILMTIAKTAEEWKRLAHLFAVVELHDLRQGVLERFLLECSDREALSLFCENVFARSWRIVENTRPENVDKCTPQMHWILSCKERMSGAECLGPIIAIFEFTDMMPRSIRERIAEYKRVNASA